MRRDALETIEAIRELKRRHPDVHTTLGISNVSFGLNAAARQVLNSVFLHECVNAGLSTAIVSAAKILPMAKIDDEQRSVALDLVYDRRREGYDPLNRFMELFEGVSASSARASRAEELAGLPLFERLERRIVDGERQGLDGRPRRGAALPARPGDHQRHAAVRHEDRRRAVRLRADAAAVRAGQRRGDEDRGGPPRAAHGARGRAGQGHHRAGHGQGRRARHRQEPGRHHPDQQRLQRGQPGHQAAHLDDPVRRRGTPGRRRGHVRAAGQVHGDHEGEPAGDELPGGAHPGAARRRRAHPLLRRERPLRGLRGPRRLRPGRVRGPAADGRHDGQGARRAARGRPGRGGASKAERKARHERSQRVAAKRRAAEAEVAGPVPERSDVTVDNPIPVAAVLGHPGGPGGRAGRVRRHGRRARAVPRAVGAARRQGRLRPVLRGAGGDRGPAAAAVLAGAAVHRGGAGARRGGLRLLPGRLRARLAGRAGRAPAGRARPAPRWSSPASAGTGTSAWPTSGGRGSWPSSAARSTCCRCTW